MMWESIVISIYNVCESNEFSTVLYAYSLNGDEFWPNVIRLVIITIFWKLIAVWVCCLKMNPFKRSNVHETVSRETRTNIL